MDNPSIYSDIPLWHLVTDSSVAFQRQQHLPEQDTGKLELF
jgi:hypothetical protein